MDRNQKISLNEKQHEAVQHLEGPLLIFAGAGSGKTRVITARIAHLIREHQVPPWAILAVTFTNKAAQEMRERVGAMIGSVAQDIQIRTFHSICLYILRNDIHHLGFSSHFTIYDNQDSQNLIKQVLKTLDLDHKKFSPSLLANVIFREKEALVSPKQMLAKYTDKDDFFYELAARVYGKYQAELEKNNALDFNDLLVKTVELFSSHPQVLQKYQDMWQYIMIDEYQDTNRVQYLFTTLLARNHSNLCVVGDDDQSIYSWRGADIRNILDFQNDFPGARIVKLEENYRSTQSILDAAHSVIAHVENRTDKRLWTSREKGELITQSFLYDEYEEARWCVEEAEKLQLEENIPFGEMAIFYRMHYQSRAIEEVLLRKKIPYVIFGGIKFYERKEIKDMLAYLKFLVNPKDEISLLRIINTPPRGIGNKTIERAQITARDETISLWQAIQNQIDNKKIRAFVNLMENYHKKVSEIGSGLSVYDLVKSLMQDSELVAYLEKDESPEAESRLQNLEELLNSIAERAEKWQNYESQDEEFFSLEKYLQEIGLYTDLDDPDKLERIKESLTLMTMHNAKGLEYRVIFMSGMEEGIFPHGSSVSKEDEGEIDEMDEERRLCYVGITRARDRLFMTSCLLRRHFGNQVPRNPSRFLNDIPPELKKIIKSAKSDFSYAGYRRPERDHADEDFSENSSDQDYRGKNAFGDKPALNLHHKYNFKPQVNSTNPWQKPVEEDGSNISQKGLKLGQYVLHAKFGKGQIRKIVQSGNLVRLYISFHGKKPQIFIESLTPLKAL